MAFARDILFTSIRPVLSEHVDKALNMHSYYDKILLTGDFNTEIYDH